MKNLFKNEVRKIYNPKSLKQIALDNIGLGDRQLKDELARRMLNPYYFTDRALQVGFKFILDSHNLHHTNSKLTITPNHPEFGIEIRYINKIMKELSVIYARLIN